MKTFITLIFLSLAGIGYSQTNWLEHPDEVNNCDFVKSGKFVNKETNKSATKGYWIVFKDGYATEYVENGKFYLKSKIEFTSDCSYKSTVIEVTIPNYPFAVGSTIQSEIVQTATDENLVKIKSSISGKENEFILQKIGDE